MASNATISPANVTQPNQQLMKAQMLPASRCVLQIQQAAASVQQHSNAVVDGIAGGALRVQDDDKAGNCERLFKGLVFFLGREVPRELREQVLFVIRAYGGVVAWQGEGSPMDESDERITHQPLWVFDSANFGVVAKAELYGVGMVPPPHLSLFVQIAEEGNVPDYSQTMLKLQEQARAACKRAACKRAAAAGTMDEYTFIAEDSTAADQIGSAPAMQDVSDEQLYEHELAQQMQALALKTSATLFEQAGSEDEEQTDAAEPTAQEAGAIAEVPDLDPEATVMMTRKQRGLYNAMQRGLSKKRQRVESLQAKAKKLKQPSS
ncbi:MAG: pescadillo protein [Trebouxia sp. A1-2]|nr:MAG: pescadillo protein [Trebouxia sp. A1-2]